MKAEVVRHRRGAALRATLAGAAVAAIVLIAGLVVTPAPSASAAESSAVTVKAKDEGQDAEWESAPFPDLEVTVSQTRDLVDQGVTVSWKGGTKSSFPDSESGGRNFLQILQCWDTDDDGGPDRESCQYGANGTAGASRDNYRPSRSVSEKDAPYTKAIDAQTSFTSIDFRSATGTLVQGVNDDGVIADINNNEFFSRQSTNEIPWAGTSGDGTGSLTFEVQTALTAPGLGCGNVVESGDGAQPQSCWLVVIPRGTADVGERNIVHSGLFWDAWKHRVAVKLDFQPVGGACPDAERDRQVVGSEIAAAAVVSWQPALCKTAGGTSRYALVTSTESDVVAEANTGQSSSGIGDVPLGLTSRSLGDAEVDGLTYAPIALGGVSIAFAIDRNPLTSAPAEEAAKARQAFTSMRLTPRLLAKLLTYSYTDSLPLGSDKSHINWKSSSDAGKNARNITYDPEFLAENPDWKNQSLASVALADILIPQGRSDAAWAVWQYILADRDARAFLSGVPDKWGMVVNPWYSTNADANPSEAAYEVPTDSLAKADPAERPAGNTQPEVNLVTWRPYTNDLAQGAHLTLRGDGQVLGVWDANAVPPRYTRESRNLPGSQQVIGLTDTASAARYHVTVAALKNPAGEFVAPTVESMQAASVAMTADPQQKQVYGFDPTSSQARAATTAYPLTMPVYAVARTDLEDTDLRGDYAAFITYAVGAGQEAGNAQGQLPSGYAPLLRSWQEQARSAAAAIAAGPAAPTPAAAAAAGAAAPAAATNSYAAPAPLAEPAAVAQPAAAGEPTTVLAGPASPADGDLGAYGAVVPASAAAGLAAAGLTLFFSRRRLL